MREIEFVNDLRCNYLTLPYEGGEEDFALRMMTENATDAFLPMELRRLDGQAYLYYNISGMQSMEILYGEKPIDRKTFQEFIWQLHVAIEESGELFLPGDGIRLTPETVFWELGTGRWKFLYVPGQDAGEFGETRGEREGFAEFLVMHIDYEDKELTEMVYRFYEEICAGVNFPWDELLFEMRAQGAETQKGDSDSPEGEIPAEDMEWGTDEEEAFGSRYPDYAMEEDVSGSWQGDRRREMAGYPESEEFEAEGGPLAGDEGKRKRQIVPWILLGVALALTVVSGKIMPEITPYCGAAGGALAVALLVASARRRRRKDGGEENVRGTDGMRDAGSAEFFGKRSDREAEYGDGETEYGGREAAYEERNFAADEKTVYMEIGEKQERKLYGIGKYRRQKIFLENLPCLVGKDKKMADHVISDPSVSRMHVKFSMEGGTVWMQDLNSTNGTYHNGMRLRPNEKVALEPEDEIGLGQVQFVFR